MPSAAGRQRGFTLIELLVSLTVMAVILALLSGALRLLGRNWDANIARIETLDMVSRALDLLARDTANLRRIVRSSGAPAYVFTGTPEHLSFVALEPPYPTEAVLYFIDYSIAAEGGRSDLIRSRALYKQGMGRFPGATPANRVPLLQGPYRYRFAYGRMVKGEQRWFGEWPFENRLPDLIRLEISDRKGAAVLASPMILRVRSDAEPECLTPQPGMCSAKSGGQLLAGTPGASPQQAEGVGTK